MLTYFRLSPHHMAFRALYPSSLNIHTVNLLVSLRQTMIIPAIEDTSHDEASKVHLHEMRTNFVDTPNSAIPGES